MNETDVKALRLVVGGLSDNKYFHPEPAPIVTGALWEKKNIDEFVEYINNNI